MKRCPLCDFIYEDDQSVCDMDGIELVHDNGALIPTAKDTTLRPNSKRPRRAVGDRKKESKKSPG